MFIFGVDAVPRWLVWGFSPLCQAERGTSGAGFLRSMFEAAGRVLIATASIVHSKGIGAADADTGVAFFCLLFLAKQEK